MQDSPGVRKAVTRHYGYLIFYSVDEAAQAIDILGLQHAVRVVHTTISRPFSVALMSNRVH